MNTYDLATDKLKKQVKRYSAIPEFSTKYDMIQAVQVFRTVFKNSDLRRQVLASSYEEDRLNKRLFSAGFCGIASYTWNHLFRMPDGSVIWRLKKVSSGEYDIGNHVWLENRFTGEALDLTFDQFIDSNGGYIEIPYDKIGKYVSSDFEFLRAYKFAKYMGIDLSKIVFENALRSLGRK